MTFDRLPDGVGPDDCEPDYYQEPEDPDRHYEQRTEREHDRERGGI